MQQAAASAAGERCCIHLCLVEGNDIWLFRCFVLLKKKSGDLPLTFGSLVTSWTLQDVFLCAFHLLGMKTPSFSTGTDKSANALPVPAWQQLQQAVADFYLPLIRHRVRLMKRRGSRNQQDESEWQRRSEAPGELKFTSAAWDACHFTPFCPLATS